MHMPARVRQGRLPMASPSFFPRRGGPDLSHQESSWISRDIERCARFDRRARDTLYRLSYSSNSSVALTHGPTFESTSERLAFGFWISSSLCLSRFVIGIAVSIIHPSNLKLNAKMKTMKLAIAQLAIGGIKQDF